MFRAALDMVRAVAEVCDIGPGIRPMTIFKAARHVCIEPHGEYADVLEQQGFPVIRKSALEGLSLIEPVDSVFLLDVIEHMSKEEGRQVLDLAIKKAREQVVVFTPLGFCKQEYQAGEKDAWGMNGTYWQTHRSGWMPEDFPGWSVVTDPTFHGERGGALCAVLG